MVDAFTSAANRPNKWWQNDVLSPVAFPAGTLIVASRSEMGEMFDRYIDHSISRLDTPLWQQGEEAASELLPSVHDEPFKAWRYCLVKVLVPALGNLRILRATQDGRRDGALLGIALELYHREHNAWPKSLSELTPRWLPAVPVDRITGRPLTYVIVNDRSMVYSVGADQDDDRGRVPLEDDGRPNAYLASPTNMRGVPNDGDWVIWSTVTSE